MSSYAMRKRGEMTWEVAADARPDMRVPARVYADGQLLEAIRRDRSLDQLVNVATLRGLRGCVYAMPDVHEGYGFPVGGVAATDARSGVISPGGVGYDINCGVRLLAAEVTAADAAGRLEAVVHDLARSIPSGQGRGGALTLDDDELDRVLEEGCHYLVERGLASAEDLDAIEATGQLGGAEAAAVSDRAKERGRSQLGTLGSGNHFVEVGVVDEVFDAEAAATFGLRPGQLTVLIHSGSRGLGHQVCTDYVKLMDRVMARYEIVLPDRELACAPLDSPEGQRYFAAMSAAGNFAWSNRQLIAEGARKVFRRALGGAGALRLVYDVAHNLAKLEDHDGVRLCVHRKGATRAFGPSHPETPARYRAAGQPVIIPGSMGTASYVLAGTDAALALSFGSTCHGAGRAMSRTAARRAAKGHEVRRALEGQGIVVRCASAGELAEEAPLAYKDVDRVVNVVHEVGIARKVARLRPLGVVKGKPPGAMGWITLMGIAVALAMDAFAVAIAAGLQLRPLQARQVFRLGFHFGLFQALMPILGWLAGTTVQRHIATYDHWVALGLLGFIGGKMVWEALRGEEERATPDPTRGWTLIGLSIATSIDALAVGLSLAMLRVSIWVPSLVIGVVCAAFTVTGMLIGWRIGRAWSRRVALIGGLVLIAIGVKICVEHLLGK